MYSIYANIGGILMVNVTIYGIHGSYGYPYQSYPLVNVYSSRSGIHHHVRVALGESTISMAMVTMVKVRRPKNHRFWMELHNFLVSMMSMSKSSGRSGSIALKSPIPGNLSILSCERWVNDDLADQSLHRSQILHQLPEPSVKLDYK